MLKRIFRVFSLLLCAAMLLGLCAGAAFAEAYTDPWGYTDEDGDGLILVEVPGDVFTAYMLIVLDPTRVVLGCRPDKIYERGYTVEEYVEQFDAAAGINGGGFEDDNGQGDGSTPDNVMMHEGEIICGYLGIGRGFVGLDADSILQVGFESVGELTERNMREGAGFGPVLVQNGEIADPEKLAMDMNPRTALGQRSDGALLMLVIDGRQPNTLGGTQLDAAEIMLDFGAVTAGNLDGGNSTLMYYDGDYVNNPAGAVNIRNVPSSFVVLKEGKEQTETLKEKFAEPDTAVTHYYVKETEENYADNCSGETREKLTETALAYLENYVYFTANVDLTGYIYFGNLSGMVGHDSELWHRLQQGSSSSGFTQTRKTELIDPKVTACCRREDGSYAVELSYSTVTTDSRATSLESRQMRLFLSETDGKLQVEGMEFFRSE